MANYLFNGIELPALPEYDKTAYPYTVIVLHTGGEYSFVFTDTAVVVSPSGMTLQHPNGMTTNNFNYGATQQIRSGAETWGDISYGTVNGYTGTAFWANFDIYDNEGTLFLAASDPVPVGGVPTLTARDLYRKINGKPTKLTLYKKVGGKLIPLDEHTKEVNT